MQASDAKRDTNLFQRVIETLNEAQRRWLVGREALRCGRGGIQRMVETSGLSKPTILKGIRELAGKGKLVAEEGRVRKPGAAKMPRRAFCAGLSSWILVGYRVRPSIFLLVASCSQQVTASKLPLVALRRSERNRKAACG